MDKIQVSVRDFNLFVEVMKSTLRLVDAAKFHIDDNGLAIYAAKSKIGRCEITSNAVYTTTPVEFTVSDLSMLVRLLGTAKEVHGDDFSDFSFSVELPFLKFSSKKFKTKLSTCNEDVIEKWVSKPIEDTEFTPLLELTTSNDYIKRVKNHQFIFADPTSMRIYLEQKPDMEKNTIYASIGNRQTNLNNEITLKFGIVNAGAIGDQPIILDLDRICMFDSVQTPSIKISLMSVNKTSSTCIVSNAKVEGKNDAWMSVKIYCGKLKA